MFVSLRTKDPETAKTRFRLAMHALDRQFDALANGPQPLTRIQRTALVGDIYREAARDLDTDDSVLDAIEATTSEFDANVAHHLGRTDERPLDGEANPFTRPADEKTAELMAAIDMYDAKALAAWAAKYETNPAKRAAALEQLYGPLVDDEIARKQLLVDENSRNLTLEAMDQVADAFGEMANRRLTSMDYADPFGAGLPAWEAPKEAKPRPAGPSRNVITVADLFELWKTARVKLAASTVRRYSSTIDTLSTFWGKKDVRLLAHADIRTWATERATKIPAATVNKNDLVAVSSVLGWATTFPAGQILASNPAKGEAGGEEAVDKAREGVPRRRDCCDPARRAARSAQSEDAAGCGIASMGGVDLRLHRLPDPGGLLG